MTSRTMRPCPGPATQRATDMVVPLLPNEAVRQCGSGLIVLFHEDRSSLCHSCSMWPAETPSIEHCLPPMPHCGYQDHAGQWFSSHNRPEAVNYDHTDRCRGVGECNDLCRFTTDNVPTCREMWYSLLFFPPTRNLADDCGAMRRPVVRVPPLLGQASISPSCFPCRCSCRSAGVNHT
jgi:hypothetical protein